MLLTEIKPIKSLSSLINCELEIFGQRTQIFVFEKKANQIMTEIQQYWVMRNYLEKKMVLFYRSDNESTGRQKRKKQRFQVWKTVMQ